MQFIERNSFSIRSALHRLRHDDGGPEYLLFPMVHIGSPAYYSEISERVAKCDMILFEGVPSIIARAVERAYRLSAWNRDLDLVSQSTMDLGHVKDRLVRADIDGSAFNAGWWALPLRHKLLFSLAIPALAFYLAFAPTKVLIGRGLDTDDFSSGGAFLTDDPSEDQLNDLLLARRDQRLVDVIESSHRENREKPIVIGVIYGAAHMRAVTRFLISRLKYRVVHSEWVTVFDL